MGPSEDLSISTGMWKPSSLKMGGWAVWGDMLELVRKGVQPFSYKSQGKLCWEAQPRRYLLES